MAASALVVFVPESEVLVESLRRAFDPAARDGVAAHITILFPFLDADRIDDSTVRALERTFAAIAFFRFELREIGRFPATTYLAPEPNDAFLRLTTEVVRAFPDYPPYGGAFREVIPHLTVSDRSVANADLAEIELRRRLSSSGPLACECCSVHLIEQVSGTWRTRHVFSLGKP